MIGKSGSKMGSVGVLLVKLISAAGARILHDFPREVALEPCRSGGTPGVRIARKAKNLQELYIAATSILGLDRPSSPGTSN